MINTFLTHTTFILFFKYFSLFIFAYKKNVSVNHNYDFAQYIIFNILLNWSLLL